MIQLLQVLTLVVIKLLEAQCIGIQALEERFDAGLSISLVLLALQQHGDALLQALEPLRAPGLKQVTTPSQDAVTFQAGCGSAQLIAGIDQGQLLQFARF